jgi:hypothetical protein
MSSASSASLLLNNMKQAEKDLAMYAAIIGCRPTVSTDVLKVEAPAESPTEQPAPSLAEKANDEHLDSSEEHPHRLQIWMRHVSDEAKKRIHEARTRLAG